MADGEEELTSKQRKNRRKKEAAKRKKQEEKQRNAGKSPDSRNNGVEEIKGNSEANEISPEEKFHRELEWCIEQLQLGLAFQKPDKRQAENTQRLLRSLKSPKTLMPRKRQIMFSVFGDYRKKMEEDKRKVKQVVANPKLSVVKQDKLKSVFVKVCQKRSNTSTTEGKAEKAKDNTLTNSWKFEPSDNSFRFHFDGSEEYKPA